MVTLSSLISYLIDLTLSSDHWLTTPTRAAQEVKIRHVFSTWKPDSHLLHLVSSFNNSNFTLQEVLSTAGCKVSWCFPYRWGASDTDSTDSKVWHNYRWSGDYLSFRSVCGEESVLPPHLWPPCQHQHSPECTIPAGRWDINTTTPLWLNKSCIHLLRAVECCVQ